MSDVVPSFNIAPGDSSSAVAQRRRLAMLLMQQGMDTSPIQHWTQGAARVAQALMGGYEMNRADQSEKDAEAKKAEFYSSFIPGGVAPAAAAPAAGNQRMAAALAAPSTSGKVYSNDEPSPLDPPSGGDRDMAIRTVLGEAGNQPQQGMSAVANVLRNRAVAGNFGGDSLPGVIQKPNQFEPWNTPQGQARMAAIDPNSQAYAQAGQAVDGAYAGAPDPTRGATHFYAPKAQAALGRPAPAWDNGKGVDIADHRFFGGAGTPPVMAGASPTDVSAQRAQPAQPAPQEVDAAARIRAGLQSKDPNIRRAATEMAQKYVTQSLDPGKPTDDMREYAAAQKQGFRGSLFDFITKKKQAGAIQNQVMIDQKGEGEFSKESGKLQAKRFNDLAEDAPAATQMLSDVALLRDLGSKIGTGKEAEVKAALGPYAEALGIKVNNLGEIQAFEAVVNRVAPNLRVKGSGAQSDFELKNFLKSLPSIGNTEGGNEIASRVLEGLSQNKMAAAEIGSKALTGEITRADAEKQLRALPDPMKEWREFSKKGPAASPAKGPQPGAVEQGYRFKGGNPADPKSWEKVQ
jgi:spore germination cell wall hydrolase CwlJ-like protein